MVFDLDTRELGSHDVDHLVERSRAAVRQIEYLVVCFGARDHQHDSLHQVADISEIERIGAIAVHRQRLATQRVLDERLTYAAADATLTIEGRRTQYRVVEVEHLIV